MTTRTVQFIGKAYSPTGSLNIALHINSAQVFNGTVAATTDPVPSGPRITHRETEVVFEFELDRSLQGSAPLVLSVTGDENGYLTFFTLKGNNTEFVGSYESLTEGQIIPLSPDYYNELCVHTEDSDGRTNIKIDDIPKTRFDEDAPTEGTAIMGNWGWWVPADSVFTCDLNLTDFTDKPYVKKEYPDYMSVPVAPTTPATP